MGWDYAILVGLFIVGVVCAFPLAIFVSIAAGGLLIGIDRFTAQCPGFQQIRRWLRRRQYRSGQVVSRFLAPDVRRDIEVVDDSRVDAGIILARVRTWNVLYATKKLFPAPPFGDADREDSGFMGVVRS